MKLQKKNTRFLLIYLPVILIICSVIFYILLNLHINHLHYKHLLLKQENIIGSLLKENGDIESHNKVFGEFSINEIDTNKIKNYDIIGDTTIFYPSINERLPFKKLTGIIHHNGKQYEITTYSSSIETTHVMIGVFAVHGFIYIVILFSIIIINRKVSERLWQPFYETMDKLSTYDISKKRTFNLNQNTGVLEFDELNRVVEKLVYRDQLAYQSQKQFVENASHEIQTPLAIIRSKSDLLMEQTDLNKKTAELINDINDATTRLSNLNKALLLLAKIDNKQFIEQKKINLSEIIDTNLSNYEEYLSVRLPQITKKIDTSCSITANQALIEILINNLIRNAIIHNIPAGKINIDLNDRRFLIENTGPELSIPTEMLFERFKKDSDKPNQSGLGLAIVKQICTMYEYQLSYDYKNHIHSLQIIF